jgi:hypothetical protein
MNLTESPDGHVAYDVLCELARARERFANMGSAHEGAAIIQEEWEELWETVKAHKVIGLSHKLRSDDAAKMRKEAVQLAAMAIRFISDVCDQEVFT